MITACAASYKNVCIFFFSSGRRHTRFGCDWSSDVCSSDLLLDAVGKRTVALEDRTLRSYLGGWPEYVRVRAEIGRASCRERVSITAVAVSLKKVSSWQSGRRGRERAM